MHSGDIVGLLGVFAYTSSYALLQMGKTTSDSLFYLSLNVVGSSFIMVSLYFNFNLPAMVAQVFWLLFTFIGILRVMRARDWKIGGSGMSAPCDRST